MSQYIPTRKGNPCQICEDVSSKCRETEGNIALCMTFSELIGAPNVPGFKFVGKTKNGLWGKWIVDDGQSWTEQQREEWKRTQTAQRQLRVTKEKEKHTQSLSAKERDRYYRKLLEQLELHPDDEADLRRRGLTDKQIKAWGVRSVEQWQKLRSKVSPLLSGVRADGRSLNTSGAGYLCPIRDINGLIVGCQIRLRDAEDGRYRWLSSATKANLDSPTPHLQNGELPLAIHRPSKLKLDSIGMAEGVGAKPFITSEKLGQVVIGAAGGLFASSPQLLKASLERLACELETRTVDFYPDAGSPTNRAVIRQYEATWNLLKDWGFIVRVGWWKQFTKEHLDIDELQSLSAIGFITPTEFLKIGHKEIWKRHYTEKRKEIARHSFTYKADVVTSDRYLPKLKLSDLKPGITVVKAPWGSGKSSNILSPIARDAQSAGYDVIQVGHLNSLLENTAPKMGLDTHKQIKDIASVGRNLVNLNTHPNLAITLHSLGAMVDLSKRNKPLLLLIDEHEQVFQSLTERQNVTLKGELRQAARRKLEHLIREAEYVLLSDADASDTLVDYIRHLRGEDKVHIIQSTFKVGVERLPIEVSTGKDPSELIKSFLDCLRNGGKAIFFVNCPQEIRSIVEQIKADPDLQKLKGQAVYGDVTSEPEVARFIESIDKEYTKLNWLVHSSSLGTGVDLNKEHFTHRFALIRGGVLSATECCQAMFRYRPDVPTLIWVTSATQARECDAEEILKALQYRESTTFDTLKCSRIAGIQASAVGEISHEDRPFLELYAKLAARKNASLSNLRESIYEVLEVSGYSLKFNEPVTYEDIKVAHREIKKRLDEQDCEAIANARVLSDEELSEKANSSTLSLADRQAVYKTLLHRDTGLEVTPELVKIDDDGRWRKGVKHLEHLLSDPALAMLDDALDQKNNPLASDRSHYTLKHNLLDSLGVKDFLKSELEWRKGDPDLAQFAERCRLRSLDIKTIWGFHIPQDPKKLSDVQVLGEFLRRLGLCTVYRQAGTGKNKEKVYRIDPARMELCKRVIEHRRKRRQEHPSLKSFTDEGVLTEEHPLVPPPQTPIQDAKEHPPLYISLSSGGVPKSKSPNSTGPSSTSSTQQISLKPGDLVIWKALSGEWEVVWAGTAIAGVRRVGEDLDWRVDLADLTPVK
ncbi:hypothetical protein NDA01_24750 [Trichocoleus desertorum AS-A10]|uniref:plasmid replication protein, CyRepA1 family n=1 Tax=Trichocoleus desertorum TaxID=1481672 RepID=UPI003298BD3D